MVWKSQKVAMDTWRIHSGRRQYKKKTIPYIVIRIPLKECFPAKAEDIVSEIVDFLNRMEERK